MNIREIQRIIVINKRRRQAQQRYASLTEVQHAMLVWETTKGRYEV